MKPAWFVVPANKWLSQLQMPAIGAGMRREPGATISCARQLLKLYNKTQNYFFLLYTIQSDRPGLTGLCNQSGFQHTIQCTKIATSLTIPV